MSGASYTTISPSELKRREEERKRRLEEERRRKEAERLLRIEIEKAQAEEAHRKQQEEKKREEAKKKRLAHEKEKQLHEIEKELKAERSTREAQTDKIGKRLGLRTVLKQGADPMKKKMEVAAHLESLETRLSEIEPLLSEFMSKEFGQFKESLSELNARPEGNYSYFEDILRGLEDNLSEIVAKAEKRKQNREKQLKIYTNKALKLCVDLEMAIVAPHLTDKGKVIEIRKAIKKALSERDLQKLMQIVERNATEVSEIYRNCLQAKRRVEERQFVAESVQGVLKEMGYEVSKLPYKTVDHAEAPLYVDLMIPGGEGVRLGLGLDKSLFAEVLHTVPEGSSSGGSFDKERFKEQEKRWCDDYTNMLSRLKESGLRVEEKWRRYLENDRIKAMEVSRHVEDDESDEYIYETEELKRMEQ